jgi:hypothetical protein
MVMGDTPIKRKPPATLDRVLAAHARRARIIAQLHEQAIASANDLAAQHTAIGAFNAKDDRRQKAEAWLCAGAFLLTLGGIVGAGCILAATVSWQ